MSLAWLMAAASELAWWTRREGGARAARRAARALRVRLFHVGLYEVHAASTVDRRAPQDGPAALEVVILEGATSRLPGGLFGPRTRARFAGRLQRGDVCLLGLLQGDLAHYTWLRVGRGGLVRVGHDEGYLFDSYTVNRHRGRGVHTAMVAHRLRYLGQRGCRRALVGVSVANGPALHVLRRKLRFRRLGLVLSMSLLGRAVRLPLASGPLAGRIGEGF